MGGDFDLIVLGPTGVTGREAVRYLGRRAAEVGASWAVAGRSPDRMAEVLDEVGAEPDAVLTADVTDRVAAHRLAESAAPSRFATAPEAADPPHRRFKATCGGQVRRRTGRSWAASPGRNTMLAASSRDPSAPT